jgi:hypothetical protein
VRALLVALLLLATPAFAADWGHYVNVRYGIATDVPPGFVGQGEADNSDGQIFTTPTAELRVFGANVFASDFEAEVRDREAADTAAGWALTYKMSTPTYAPSPCARARRSASCSSHTCAQISPPSMPSSSASSARSARRKGARRAEPI